MNQQIKMVLTASVLITAFSLPALAQQSSRIPGTAPFTLEGDVASHLVAGVDRFLLGELKKSVVRRARYWHYDFSSPEAYSASVQPNRERLAHIIGVRDERIDYEAPELIATTDRPALISRGDGVDVYAVRWPAFGDVHAEGLFQ